MRDHDSSAGDDVDGEEVVNIRNERSVMVIVPILILVLGLGFLAWNEYEERGIRGVAPILLGLGLGTLLSVGLQVLEEHAERHRLEELFRKQFGEYLKKPIAAMDLSPVASPPRVPPEPPSEVVDRIKKAIGED